MKGIDNSAVIKHKGRVWILANYSNHLVETANVSFSLQAGSCPRQHLNPRYQCSDIWVSKPMARGVCPAPCPCLASPINLGTHATAPALRLTLLFNTGFRLMDLSRQVR